MTTHDLYAKDPGTPDWQVPASGAARFSWDYDDGRDRLLALYQKGKDKQWDSVRRIDWDLEVDPYDPLGTPDEALALHGTRHWSRMTERDKGELRRHYSSWQFSQFLHGEQGAMICAARIVESVPDLDAKFYSATQTMDEARHAEIYGRFLHEKIGMLYPINDNLQALLGDTLRDSRWDMPYLGMQVLIEGLALAAFGMIRDTTDKPLPKQILAYVMQDEARHVAFGRMALRDYYRQLTDAELREREEFVIEGCYLMRDRLRGTEVLENFGIPAAEAAEYTEQSEFLHLFRKLLFSRIVPCVKDIGLWGERLQRAYLDLGVFELGDSNLDLLMAQDEELAEQLDAERFAAEESARTAEVTEAIAEGTAAGS
ncbi:MULTISPECIES: ferritin-like domain-containing protein [Streptomyces]|uniref:Ferritin-like domain-containing protein n=2 Tax=Streptomyces TaxID=1883 RepID=A0A3R7HKL7_9ACTN|nr:MULTISPECIES: ferritin-like domain-containing protein [Streptomyces]KNE83516.1 aminobenzoate oxygenase [Streptomyces fradiae]PQM24602.1 aminobenzoate oxygenase [Streptomyces xinghaiensis]RKM97475.1 ferritin-like domain-containing protein [Streptomyces xinghaiensis]RNC75634.1 ferritin-like domain-containing protein [Streptomyces xinghaiensis]